MRIDQRYAIKFCVRLGKTPTETFEMVKTAYPADCVCQGRVFEWHKKFKGGCESVEDEPCSGQNADDNYCKEVDEEECCTVDIKQEVVDPLFVIKEDNIPSLNERSDKNTLATDVIKEETCLNFSENESKKFEFKNNFKIEVDEFVKTRDVIEDYINNPSKRKTELNINEINPGILFFLMFHYI